VEDAYSVSQQLNRFWISNNEDKHYYGNVRANRNTFPQTVTYAHRREKGLFFSAILSDQANPWPSVIV
jgi:hypothetical protein